MCNFGRVTLGVTWTNHIYIYIYIYWWWDPHVFIRELRRLLGGVWYEGIYITLGIYIPRNVMSCNLDTWECKYSYVWLIENLRECEILMFGLFLEILKELFIFLILPLNFVNPISIFFVSSSN